MTLVAAVDSRDAQHPSDQLILSGIGVASRRMQGRDACGGSRACVRRQRLRSRRSFQSIGLDDLTGDWQAHPVAPRVPQRVPGPYAWTER